MRFGPFLVRQIAAVQKALYSRRQRRFSADMGWSEAVSAFPDRNQLYAYTHHYFHHLCPESIRKHRFYFQAERRGFGEDAFHAMWWLLLREFRPSACLEIGVYRGQVISLWSTIARLLRFPIEVHGISPFTSAGDSVSRYAQDVDYLTDVLASFRLLQLDEPILVRSLSTDPPAIAHVTNRRWDLIYIDGSHEHDVVLQDYFVCRESLNPDGILVLDDSSVGTCYRPPLFSFAGHSGPSRVAAEHAARDLEFLGAVGHNTVFRKPRGQRTESVK